MNMPITVAKVPYLNYEPFYFDMQLESGFQTRVNRPNTMQGQFNLIKAEPSEVAELMLAGEIDAGPVPVADIKLIESFCYPVSHFAISTANQAGNLFLYSKIQISELEGKTIQLTTKGATSNELVKILLQCKYGFNKCVYVTEETENDAILMIGDPALRARFGLQGYSFKYDLGLEWSEWTKLPLVTSKWYANNNLPKQDQILIENTLYVGMEEGVTTLCNTNETIDHLLMRPKDIVSFIRGFKYFSGNSETKGLMKLKEYLDSV
ncbi:MAG TPA: hypothetical protein DEZ08_01030 [Dehalococcoidia bacterium]|jgi:chorismate dehydratase|nr:hypothetical protein [Dehalococcoidia bacterium]|tara:strand:- start:119 stop:913 length:795 start_codon:yes stop_codon:yes gene_type:complete